LEGRCDWLRVQTPTGFTCTFDIKAVGNGDFIPTLSIDVGYRVVGQGAISADAGTLYSHVEIPRTRTPQRFDIRTSLR